MNLNWNIPQFGLTTAKLSISLWTIITTNYQLITSTFQILFYLHFLFYFPSTGACFEEINQLKKSKSSILPDKGRLDYIEFETLLKPVALNLNIHIFYSCSSNTFIPQGIFFALPINYFTNIWYGPFSRIHSLSLTQWQLHCKRSKHHNSDIH